MPSWNFRGTAAAPKCVRSVDSQRAIKTKETSLLAKYFRKIALSPRSLPSSSSAVRTKCSVFPDAVHVLAHAGVESLPNCLKWPTISTDYSLLPLFFNKTAPSDRLWEIAAIVQISGPKLHLYISITLRIWHGVGTVKTGTLWAIVLYLHFTTKQELSFPNSNAAQH